MNTTSEVELMRRVAAGDPDALSALYDRYSANLLSLAARVLHNLGDAEDVLQEVFVHVWNRAESYDRSRSSVSTWLVLITRSRAIDRLRSRQVVERTASAAQHEIPIANTSPQGARTVLDRERRQRVLEEMRSLPPEQYRVLEMAFYRGMTQSEIAEETGIPLGTVKTRTLLAMKKLRRALRADIRELL